MNPGNKDETDVQNYLNNLLKPDHRIPLQSNRSSYSSIIDQKDEYSVKSMTAFLNGEIEVEQINQNNNNKRQT